MSALEQRLIAEVARTPIPSEEAIANALQPFVAQPGPASFLAAVRALRKARRDERVSDALTEHRRRERERAIERLRETGATGERLAGLIAASTQDRKSAARVHALACLIGAYEELEARAQRERDEWRKKIGLGT